MWRNKVCKPLGLVVAAAMLLVSSATNAAPITFFGEDLGLGEGTALSLFPNATAAEALFLSNLSGGVGTQDFAGFSAGTGAPLALTFPGSTGSITATLSGSGFVANVAPGTTNGAGRYATSGSQYWDTSGSFSIAFSSPVSAFGFFGIDIGDFGGQVTVETAGGADGLNMTGTSKNPYRQA